MEKENGTFGTGYPATIENKKKLANETYNDFVPCPSRFCKQFRTADGK